LIRTVLVAVTWLFMCGCTLLVGTETRVVGDGGVNADAVTSDAPACSSSKGCLASESRCRTDCNGALSDCERPCETGPKGAKCTQDCKTASQSCQSKCTSGCSSCAFAAGCDPTGCQN
jgi:hypothetical protein